MKIRSTTVLAVRRGPLVVIGADGQVSMGNTVMKGTAKKVRRMVDGKVIAGFAGSAADGIALFEKLEAKLKDSAGNLARACVELAKDWRTDRILRRLEALLLVADTQKTFVLSGTGDVIEPDEGVASIGSGGPYALAAARALMRHTELPARPLCEAALQIAGEICIYTNQNLSFEELRSVTGKVEMLQKQLTPRAIVEELDRYIVGQRAAKRAVAIALRNRWRRQQVPDHLRDEIAPKNIIMIGPTGVGKTEIARRLAKLARAPFVKVEASKFTEVGYVGRDVESMVRDLAEIAVKLVKDEETQRVAGRAREAAEERVLDVLLPPAPRTHGLTARPPGPDEEPEPLPDPQNSTREKFRVMLRQGKLDDRTVEIEVQEGISPMVEIFSAAGVEQMGLGGMKDLFGSMKRAKRRKVKIPEALDLMSKEEAEKLIDQDAVVKEAVDRAENAGIIFIDEIDKVAGREGGGSHGPDVSREGVQRDLLPIVEGSTVTTKYGALRTDHVLFIAAGAFHVSKPSDLIPELQGRFPIRVELEALTDADFVRILQEPENSLVKQYVALLATEGVKMIYEDGAVQEIARIAALVNSRTQNIGARRLHTVMERLLDELSFSAPDIGPQEIRVTAQYVQERLRDVVENEDLSKYIL